MPAPLLLLLLLMALAAATAEIRVPVQPDGSYAVLLDNTTWLPSGATFFRHGNATYSTHDGSLKLVRQASSAGSDAAGVFNRTRLQWRAGDARVETSVRVYERHAVFRQAFTSGLSRTDCSALGAEGVASGWPSFRMDPLPRRGVVSWQGIMAGMDTKTGSWGAAGVVGTGIVGTGPIAIFNENVKRTSW